MILFWSQRITKFFNEIHIWITRTASEGRGEVSVIRVEQKLWENSTGCVLLHHLCSTRSGTSAVSSLLSTGCSSFATRRSPKNLALPSMPLPFFFRLFFNGGPSGSNPRPSVYSNPPNNEHTHSLEDLYASLFLVRHLIFQWHCRSCEAPQEIYQRYTKRKHHVKDLPPRPSRAQSVSKTLFN